MILRRIARPLLASAFVASGVDAIRSPKPIAQSAAPLVDKARTALPPEVADKVPENTETLVQINAAAQIGGGILLATGKFPRLASVVLVGTLIPTTAAGTDFWNEADPVRKEAQRNAFIKNVGLLGGVLLAAVDTEGKPSLAWRGRQKATAVAAALPIGASAGSSAWETFVERTHEGAEVVGERSAEAGELLSKGAHLVSERSVDAAAKFREHAPEIAEVAQKRSAEFAGKAADTAAEVAERIRDRAPVLADAAVGRSSDLAETARKRGPELAKQAKKAQKKATKQAKKNAPKIADAARDRSAELAELARDRSAEFAELARARSAELAESARQLAAAAEETASHTADEGRKRWRKARG
ncbi:DoxX family membrane protein [Gordonia sp. GONU]|uniref:DoxX family membrane protein n=1 Tax=Gordonia amicalis TaxID=89053 RepID=A0AAE4R926_9ACTN|nr:MULTISPECIES: DoxX family protein [Gordonia]MCR8899499.1 DoxX family membrane protein [Gordonia sp. GONU]MCZ4652210.1 DoxX family membrane protein [Gordonia amicalis]MDV6314287.1 DoxX family membrane protein [Gordonia amicalis]